MDALSLSVTLISYLSKSLLDTSEFKKAKDEFVKATWAWIRPIFLKDEEPLLDFEKHPENEINNHLLAAKIAKAMESDRANLSELSRLLEMYERIESDANRIVVIQKHHGTGDNIGRDKIIKLGK